MTDKKDKALKLALEALEYIDRQDNDRDFLSPEECCDLDDAITAIREALTLDTVPLAEQPAQQQEPYGQVTVVRRPGCVDQHWFYRWPEPPYLDNAAECHTVYTYPPASKPWVAGKTWVGLTEEEISSVLGGDIYDENSGLLTFVRAIEAKLREKNQ